MHVIEIIPPTMTSAAASPAVAETANNAESAAPGCLDRFMMRQEVQAVTSLSTTTLYRLIAKGEFPRSIKLSGKRCGWSLLEVSRWQAERLALRNRRVAERAGTIEAAA